MKVLLINKYHYLKGGAERAYFDMGEILAKHGHEVAYFSMEHPENRSGEWNRFFAPPAEYRKAAYGFRERFRLAKGIIYNRSAGKRLGRLLDEFRPDVAHLHNIYHQLSPSVIAALKRRGIPVVMTLHDYKLVSPNYNLFVRGRIWEHGSGWRCVSDRCVHDSYSRSLICALEQWVHRAWGIYGRVDRYLSPSRFLIRKFEELGFPYPIDYLPNPLPAVPSAPAGGRDSRVLLFFGRLSVEKGVETALEALVRLPGEYRLRIAGTGPDEERLRQMAAVLGVDGRTDFLGHLDPDSLEIEKHRAGTILLPSVWYENLPYALIESLASGCVVVASRIGGMAERIEDGKSGFLFTPGDPAALAAAVERAAKANPEAVSAAAKESVRDLDPEAFYKELIQRYGELTK